MQYAICQMKTNVLFIFSGIGKKVWFKCMEVLRDRNIFLTGVAHMVPVYNQWGFKTPIREVKGTPTIPSDFQPSSSVQASPSNYCREFG